MHEWCLIYRIVLFFKNAVDVHDLQFSFFVLDGMLCVLHSHIVQRCGIQTCSTSDSMNRLEDSKALFPYTAFFKIRIAVQILYKIKKLAEHRQRRFYRNGR